MKEAFSVKVSDGGRGGVLGYSILGDEAPFCLLATVTWEDGSRASAVSGMTFSGYADVLDAAAFLAENTVTPMTLDESLDEFSRRC